MTTEFRAVAAVGHVLRSTFGNIGFAFRVSWPWMIFILMLQLLTILLFPDLQRELETGTIKTWSEMTPQFLTVLGVTYFGNIIALSSIAVNWHRYILLDEEAEGWDRLRLDGLVMSYIGNAFLAQFIAWGLIAVGSFGVVAVVAVISLLGSKVATGIASVVLFSIFGLWCIAAIQRLMIKLPAIAVEHTDYGFRDAWADTRGAALRLVGFVLMLIAIVLVAAAILAGPAYLLGLYSSTVSLPAQLALACVQFVVNWVLVIMGVTSLTTLYGIFGEGREV